MTHDFIIHSARILSSSRLTEKSNFRLLRSGRQDKREEGRAFLKPFRFVASRESQERDRDDVMENFSAPLRHTVFGDAHLFFASLHMQNANLWESD